MNTDWIAYLITAAAAIALIVIFVRKRKKGSCCKDSCSLSDKPDGKKRPPQHSKN